ncbi:MAG: M1 family peptidase, partial [Crocinitomicaceae bacterium]|nr:M1 family peptidase [Crocinitomicaceae bacterium]
MKYSPIILLISFLYITSSAQGQKKFAQIEELIPTPNEYRNAAGAPGHNYYQQQADYKMNIVIDDATQMLKGDEIITYTNNSPDALSY